MAMAYNPSTRANDFQVRYVVNTTGDRWFIPHNNNKTKLAQATACSTMCGVTADDSVCGSELVAS